MLSGDDKRVMATLDLVNNQEARDNVTKAMNEAFGEFITPVLMTGTVEHESTMGYIYGSALFETAGFFIGVEEISLASRTGSFSEGLLTKIKKAFPSRSDVVANGFIGTGGRSNRFIHIFGKQEHALDDLVQKFGSEQDAYDAVQKAANDALKEGKLTPDKDGILPNGDNGNIIDVDGMDVRLIGGKVENGKVNISSFSRKDLK